MGSTRRRIPGDCRVGETAGRFGPVVPVQIAVIGASEVAASAAAAAEGLGSALAKRGAVVVCGGLTGVMAAACRGAKSAGGTTVGILPGSDRSAANPWVDVVIPTGLGEARNALVVGAAGAVIALDGGYGTLSEIAFALRAGRPVIGMGTWSLVRPDGGIDDGIVLLDDPEAAAEVAVALAEGSVR